MIKNAIIEAYLIKHKDVTNYQNPTTEEKKLSTDVQAQTNEERHTMLREIETNFDYVFY